MTKLPTIIGPTSVGKTEIACEVAPLIGAEIVSADSRQVYKLMDIGTGKPSPEQRKEVPHWLIDLVHPDEDYSAADYARDADRVIHKLVSGGRLPLVVGGSGLYLRALVEGFFEAPKPSKEMRGKLLKEAEVSGVSALHRNLEQVDPEAAKRIHPQDLQRIVRALEVYQQTGVPISQLQQEGAGRRFLPLYIGLARDRRDLYRRIEERVDEMIEEGFVEEVDSLLEAGYSPELNSFSAVGYREIVSHLKENVALEEAIGLIKRNTKRYAKRQLTWFQAVEGIRWIELKEESELSEAVRKISLMVQGFVAAGASHDISLSDKEKGRES